MGLFRLGGQPCQRATVPVPPRRADTMRPCARPRRSVFTQLGACRVRLCRCACPRSPSSGQRVSRSMVHPVVVPGRRHRSRCAAGSASPREHPVAIRKCCCSTRSRPRTCAFIRAVVLDVCASATCRCRVGHAHARHHKGHLLECLAAPREHRGLSAHRFVLGITLLRLDRHVVDVLRRRLHVLIASFSHVHISFNILLYIRQSLRAQEGAQRAIIGFQVHVCVRA